MLEGDTNPKTKKIMYGIIVGLAAIILVYYIFYSGPSKKETSSSQVVIPEQTNFAPDTLSQGVPDSTTMYQETESTQQTQQPVEETVQKPAEKREKAVVPSTSSGSFTIYVGSFKSKALAVKEQARLIEKEYEAFILPHGEMFRVAVGKFESREEAKQLLAELKSGVNKDSWIDKIE